MKRIVVLGATGFHGKLIYERLTAAGLKPVAASRSSAGLRIDANDAQSIKAGLRPRDLVIDAAGPFQQRTPALIEAARTIGFDVIDLSDSPEYSSKIYELEAPIRAAGIRVLTACSTMSTVSAAVLAASGLTEPRRLSAYIVPPMRKSATAGSIGSFLTRLNGSSRSFRFPQQLGKRWGVMLKTVDSVTLPRLHPTLRSTQTVVDTRSWNVNVLMLIASKWPALRRVMQEYTPTLLDAARRFGTRDGVIAYEIVSAAQANKYVIFSGEKLPNLAVLPAIQAATTIATGRFTPRGVVPPHEHVDLKALFEAIRLEGIIVTAPSRPVPQQQRPAPRPEIAELEVS